MSKRAKRARTATRRRKADDDVTAQPPAGDGLRTAATVLPALLRHADEHPEATSLRTTLVGRLRSLQSSHGNQYVQGLVARQERGAGAAAATPDLELARELFRRAAQLHDRRRYQQAIDLFQQVADMSGLPDQIREDCRHNIGQSLRLQGMVFFRQRQYARAIIRFERLRQMRLPTVSERFAAQLVRNIAACNLWLRRYNTAIVYLEKYRDMSGVNAEERASTETLLVRVKRRAGIPLQHGPAPVERQREMFLQARDLFARDQFTQAIVRFERVRQLPGISEDVARDSLWNIGLCNLRLRRFATAIIYFERYKEMSGADVRAARIRIREAKIGAGVAVKPEQASG